MDCLGCGFRSDQSVGMRKIREIRWVVNAKIVAKKLTPYKLRTTYERHARLAVFMSFVQMGILR